MKNKNKDIVVYTTYSHDGIIRMALHPMDRAPRLWDSRFTQPKKKYGFRIVWTERDYEDSEFMESCRGKDCTYIMSDFGMTHSMRRMDPDSAMKWLLEGEKQNEQEAT